MDTALLIQMVKDHPLLYDSNHPLNRVKEHREKAWRKIAKHLNSDSQVVKSKWRNLKDCYAKHLRLAENKASPKANRRYWRWRWATYLNFMMPHLKTMKSVRQPSVPAIKEEHDSHEIYFEQDQLDSPLADEPECTYIRIEESRESDSEILRDHDMQDVQASPDVLKGECQTQVITKRQKQQSDTPTSGPSDRSKYRKSLHSINNFTATELIFLGYAKTVDSLSRQRQGRIKMKIAKLVMTEEMADYESGAKKRTEKSGGETDSEISDASG